MRERGKGGMGKGLPFHTDRPFKSHLVGCILSGFGQLMLVMEELVAIISM